MHVQLDWWNWIHLGHSPTNRALISKSTISSENGWYPKSNTDPLPVLGLTSPWWLCQRLLCVTNHILRFAVLVLIRSFYLFLYFPSNESNKWSMLMYTHTQTHTTHALTQTNTRPTPSIPYALRTTLVFRADYTACSLCRKHTFA